MQAGFRGAVPKMRLRAKICLNESATNFDLSVCLILTKRQCTNETITAKNFKTASPACHPRMEKTSQCDVFEVNFQKHGINDVLFESASLRAGSRGTRGYQLFDTHF